MGATVIVWVVIGGCSIGLRNWDRLGLSINSGSFWIARGMLWLQDIWWELMAATASVRMTFVEEYGALNQKMTWWRIWQFPFEAFIGGQKKRESRRMTFRILPRGQCVKWGFCGCESRWMLCVFYKAHSKGKLQAFCHIIFYGRSLFYTSNLPVALIKVLSQNVMWFRKDCKASVSYFIVAIIHAKKYFIETVKLWHFQHGSLNIHGVD